MSDSINFFVGLKLVALGMLWGRGRSHPCWERCFVKIVKNSTKMFKQSLKKNGEFFTVGHPLIGERFLYILGEGGLAKNNLFKRKWYCLQFLVHWKKLGFVPNFPPRFSKLRWTAPLSMQPRGQVDATLVGSFHRLVMAPTTYYHQVAK